MRLDKVKIRSFKNLRDFSIDFDENSSPTVLVGQNGAGKSNLLEALVLIFRDLDLDVPPPFAYEIQYICRGRIVWIAADPEARPAIKVKINGQDAAKSRLMLAGEERCLPNFVFGYYSGTSRRMEKHFEKHQERFYDDLLKGRETPLRPLFYARLVHSQFVLLSFFSEQNKDVLQFLNKNLSIEGLDSVLFVMTKPPWKSKIGDPRFWNAHGTVEKLLDKLYSLALAPLRIQQRISTGFKEVQTVEHLYLYLTGQDKLAEFASIYDNQQEFFKALESTYISQLVREVRIRVRVRKADGSLTFHELSEGEQQLLMVLGLLKFTKEDEALFLLDEPDTHLNPGWSRHYLSFIRDIVGDQDTSHIIMSTHNPIVLAGLKKDQVQIMSRDKVTNQIYAQKPEEDPRGMGIGSILTSDIFGLPSSLDLETESMLDERRQLAVKEEDNQLTPEEKERQIEIERQLEHLEIVVDPDPMYSKFVEALTKRSPDYLRDETNFSPDQVAEQKRLAAQIVNELEV